MGNELQVEPDTLNNAANGFHEAGSQLSGLQVDAPLCTAAGGATGLRTAEACRAAGTNVVGQRDAVAKDATAYSTDLAAVAVRYRQTDAHSPTAVVGTIPGS